MDLPDGTPRQITLGGGSGSRWLPDGRGLVHTDGARLWQIDADPDGTLDASRARQLPGGRCLVGGGDLDRDHDGVSPEGRVAVDLSPVITPDLPLRVWGQELLARNAYVESTGFEDIVRRPPAGGIGQGESPTPRRLGLVLGAANINKRCRLGPYGRTGRWTA